jgi:hypothetical protein
VAVVSGAGVATAVAVAAWLLNVGVLPLAMATTVPVRAAKEANEAQPRFAEAMVPSARLKVKAKVKAKANSRDAASGSCLCVKTKSQAKHSMNPMKIKQELNLIMAKD